MTRRLSPAIPGLLSLLVLGACSAAPAAEEPQGASSEDLRTYSNVLTPASGGSIRDAKGNVWAFLGGTLPDDGCDTIYGKNGSMPYGSAAATHLVIYNGVLHQRSCIYGWYHDTGSGFAPDSDATAATLNRLIQGSPAPSPSPTTPPPPPPPSAPPFITPGSGGSVTDAQGNVWAFLGGTLAGDSCDTVYGKNGSMPYGGAAATHLVIYNGVLHQLSCIYGWYHDTGSSFQPDSAADASTLDAIIGGAPAPTPTPTPTPDPTPDPTPTPVPAPTPTPTPGWMPPGNQVAISPSGFPGSLASVGAGNTAVLAPGNYPGFTVPAGVTIYSPSLGAANVGGTIDCGGHDGCTIVGLTVNDAFIVVSGNGPRISRNTFHRGHDNGDGFGASAIKATGLVNALIDHNEFDGVTGTTVLIWNMDGTTITQNSFINVRQGIDCEFSAPGHGNDTMSANYFTDVSRMPIECGTGGVGGYTAFSNLVVDGNYAENFAWPFTGDTSGNVAYSIVGGPGGENSRITNNTALMNGAMGIGIELNRTGVVTGNRITNVGWACVEVYGDSGFDVENNDLTNCAVQVGNYQNGSGTIQNNSTGVTPPKPQTGPSAP